LLIVDLNTHAESAKLTIAQHKFSQEIDFFLRLGCTDNCPL